MYFSLFLRIAAARYKEYHKLSKDVKNRTKVESTQGNDIEKEDIVNDAQKAMLEPSKSDKQTLTSQETGTLTHTTPRKNPENKEIAILRFATKEYINPTPQRNGKVLGLFESFMSPSSRAQLSVSPTKKRQELSDKAHFEASTGGAIINSPSQSVKRKGDRIDDLRTPSKKRSQDRQDMDWKTPQSLRNLSKDPVVETFKSPVFFKNRRLSPDNPDESPQKILPRRPPVRGFSTMLAELRQAEKDAVDVDAEEAMCQMDDEEEAMLASILGSGNGAKENESLGSIVPPDFLSSAADLHETSISLGQADNKVTRLWKKKGLKRQTKRVKSKHSFSDCHFTKDYRILVDIVLFCSTACKTFSSKQQNYCHSK